jgi:RHS repeat-associated protein
LTDGAVEFLHREAMATVRVICDNAGQRARRLGYRPFGEQLVHTFNAAVEIGDEGFIGERHDAGAGLMYLNARYYDPELGLFLQPGWWEVTEPGVGTNRYAYSFNDPVNGSDPRGNLTIKLEVEISRDLPLIGGFEFALGVAVSVYDPWSGGEFDMGVYGSAGTDSVLEEQGSFDGVGIAVDALAGISKGSVIDLVDWSDQKSPI